MPSSDPTPQRPTALIFAGVAAVVAVALAVCAMTGVLTLSKGGGGGTTKVTHAAAASKTSSQREATTKAPPPATIDVTAVEFCDLMEGDLALDTYLDWTALSTEDYKRYDELFRTALQGAAAIPDIANSDCLGLAPDAEADCGGLNLPFEDAIDAIKLGSELGDWEAPEASGALSDVTTYWQQLASIADTYCPIAP